MIIGKFKRDDDGVSHDSGQRKCIIIAAIEKVVGFLPEVDVNAFGLSGGPAHLDSPRDL